MTHVPSGADCGCDDYGTGVSRRSLLKAAGLATMAGVATSMFGDVMTSTVYGATEGNILVVVSLRGGADGLSMMVPHAEKAYYDARPTTSIARSQLLWPDVQFGMHPAFAPLKDMWGRNQVAAMHAIGLKSPNRSHFEAMELIEDADPGSSARVGWINRMIEGLATSPDVFDGVQVGSTVTPTSLVGPAPSLATVEFGDLMLPFRKDEVMLARLTSSLRSQYSGSTGPLGGVGLDALTLSSRAGQIDGAVSAGAPSGVTYPKYSALGEALGTTAGLIRAKVGVKAVAVDAGGWDHHVDLSWRVRNSITELAECLAAFFTDLGADASRVTVVTISEFGRRLTENGSKGVDHGYGNAMLALGAGVKGGYYTKWPTLGAGSQIDGDLAMTTDYRTVLKEILASRFPALDASRVFPGVTDTPLGFMRAATSG